MASIRYRLTAMVPTRFRAAIANGFWAYMLQATNMLVALALLPYLTRALGRSGYGTFATALNYITYLSIFTAWGFDMWGAREATHKDSRDLSVLFTRITWARVVLMFISVLALLILAVFSDKSSKNALFAMVLALIGLTFNQNWLFLGTQRLRLAALATIVTKIPFLAAVVLVVRDASDTVLYCLLYGVSILAGSVAQLILARKDAHLRLVAVRSCDVWSATREAAPLFVANIMNTVANGVGITVLTIRSSPAEVGDYAAVLRIATTVLLLFSPLWTALYPQACRRYLQSSDAGNRFVVRISVLLLPIFAVISIIVIVGRDLFVRIVLGGAYTSAASILVPLMIWTLLGVAGNLLGTQCLVASGHQREYSRALIFSTIATVVLTLALVPEGSVGVGWATAVGQFVSVLIMFALIYVINRRKRALSSI